MLGSRARLAPSLLSNLERLGILPTRGGPLRDFCGDVVPGSWEELVILWGTEALANLALPRQVRYWATCNEIKTVVAWVSCNVSGIFSKLQQDAE